MNGTSRPRPRARLSWKLIRWGWLAVAFCFLLFSLLAQHAGQGFRPDSQQSPFIFVRFHFSRALPLPASFRLRLSLAPRALPGSFDLQSRVQELRNQPPQPSQMVVSLELRNSAEAWAPGMLWPHPPPHPCFLVPAPRSHGPAFPPSPSPSAWGPSPRADI